MVGIYKITSPSNRIYIGQSNNIDKRIKNYKKLIHCNLQPRLYRSFLKYGVENHFFDIIEECDECFLNERERYWQEVYDVINNGLNCLLTKTDNKSGKMSDETKKKISLGNTGKFFSEERRINISNGRKGIMHSEETKIKISKVKKGTKHSEETKIKIGIESRNRIRTTKEVVDIDTGEIFRSTTHAANSNGISVSHLMQMLKGNRNNNTNLKYLQDV
jgi:group I intron endonuclease